MNNLNKINEETGSLKILCHDASNYYIGCRELNMSSNKDLHEIDSFVEPIILTINQVGNVNCDILFDCPSFTNNTIKKLILIKCDDNVLKIAKHLVSLEEIMLEEFKLTNSNYWNVRKILNELPYLKRIILRYIDCSDSSHIREYITNYCKYRDIELEFP